MKKLRNLDFVSDSEKKVNDLDQVERNMTRLQKAILAVKAKVMTLKQASEMFNVSVVDIARWV